VELGARIPDVEGRTGAGTGLLPAGTGEEAPGEGAGGAKRAAARDCHDSPRLSTSVWWGERVGGG